MKFSTPLPQPLPRECIRAASIFRSFITSGNNGLDRVIPRSVLQNATGFVIFTVIKAGFVVSARAGAGLVIARLPDGSFSAPSAIGTAGMGFGTQAGAEVTDFLIVLNSRSALRSFMSAGSLTLGGNMSLAIGPLGRNGEALGALNSKGRVAAMYSYSKTKGLFGGASIEGSIIVERQDANAIAYQSDVTAKQLLSGTIDAPEWANILIQTLESTVGVPNWIEDEPLSPVSESGRPSMSRGYSFQGFGSDISSPAGGSRLKKAAAMNPFGRNQNRNMPPAPVPHPSNGADVDLLSDLPDLDGNHSHKFRNHNDKETGPQFDGFADSDEEDPWGDSPNFTPATVNANLTSMMPAKPAVFTGFAKHFESDFRPNDDYASVPKPRLVAKGPPRPSVHQQISDITTSLDAFTFDLEAPQPRRANTTPVHTVTGISARPWDYDIDTRTRSPSTPSLRSDSRSSGPSSRVHSPASSKPSRPLSVKPGVKERAPSGTTKAVAMFDYDASEPGDLSFREGDVIYVMEKSESTNDWWKGHLAAQPASVGVFPANFVSLDA